MVRNFFFAFLFFSSIFSSYTFGSDDLKIKQIDQFILSNCNECVEKFEDGKIYLSNLLDITPEGILLMYESGWIRIPELLSDARGCYITFNCPPETLPRCNNYSSCKNPNCPCKPKK